MKFVRNLENFFEKYIEGFFNKKFESGLQPVEIAKHLLREMENERSIGVSHIYVPNLYHVNINNRDFEHLSPYSEAIQEELAEYLKQEAKQRGYTIVGKPIIEITSSTDVGAEKFQVASSFTEPLPLSTPSIADEPNDFSDTRVFDKLSADIIKPEQLLTGTLTIVDGLDTGDKFDIGINRVNIGRRDTNEIPLTDMNTSRLHSYIVCEDNQHILYDAKSLNGTYVNGHRVTRWRLRSGDKIKLGNTIILYEVR